MLGPRGRKVVGDGTGCSERRGGGKGEIRTGRMYMRERV